MRRFVIGLIVFISCFLLLFIDIIKIESSIKYSIIVPIMVISLFELTKGFSDFLKKKKKKKNIILILKNKIIMFERFLIDKIVFFIIKNHEETYTEEYDEKKFEEFEEFIIKNHEYIKDFDQIERFTHYFFDKIYNFYESGQKDIITRKQLTLQRNDCYELWDKLQEIKKELKLNINYIIEYEYVQPGNQSGQDIYAFFGAYISRDGDYIVKNKLIGKGKINKKFKIKFKNIEIKIDAKKGI